MQFIFLFVLKNNPVADGVPPFAFYFIINKNKHTHIIQTLQEL